LLQPDVECPRGRQEPEPTRIVERAHTFRVVYGPGLNEDRAPRFQYVVKPPQPQDRIGEMVNHSETEDGVKTAAITRVQVVYRPRLRLHPIQPERVGYILQNRLVLRVEVEGMDPRPEPVQDPTDSSRETARIKYILASKPRRLRAEVVKEAAEHPNMTGPQLAAHLKRSEIMVLGPAETGRRMPRRLRGDRNRVVDVVLDPGLECQGIGAKIRGPIIAQCFVDERQGGIAELGLGHSRKRKGLRHFSALARGSWLVRGSGPGPGVEVVGATRRPEVAG